MDRIPRAPLLGAIALACLCASVSVLARQNGASIHQPSWAYSTAIVVLTPRPESTSPAPSPSPITTGRLAGQSSRPVAAAVALPDDPAQAAPDGPSAGLGQPDASAAPAAATPATPADTAPATSAPGLVAPPVVSTGPVAPPVSSGTPSVIGPSSVASSAPAGGAGGPHPAATSPFAATDAKQIEFKTARPAATPTPAESASTPETGVSPLPEGSATPAAPRRKARTSFGITGTASVSEQIARNRTTSDSQFSNVFGMLATVEHRTDTAALTVRLPAAVSLRSSTLGELDVTLAARNVLFGYRSEVFAPLGLLPLGTIRRALSIEARPRADLDVQALTGTVLGDGSQEFTVEQVRARFGLRPGIFAVGLATARSKDGSASEQMITGGFATRPGRIDANFEGALERTSGPLTTGDIGSAYTGRVNVGGDRTYVSYVRRYLSPTFTSIGGSLFQSGDRYDGFSYRALLNRTQVGFESVYETLLADRNGDAAYQSRNALNLSRPIGAGNASLSLSTQRSIAGGETSSIRSISESYGFPAGRKLSIVETVGLEKQNHANARPSASTRYEATIRDRFSSKLSAEGSVSRSRIIDDVQPERVDTLRGLVERSLGRSTLGLAANLSHTLSTNVDVVQRSLSAIFTRRLNASTSVQVQYGLQSTRDRINPTGNGSSSLFNVAFGAPIALGNGTRVGRADPRLPAVVRGSVYDGSTASIGGFASGGIGGVTVVLDGTETRRTDFLGNFEFSFVTAGKHELAIDPASLPRGSTPDFPAVPVSVDGGQTAVVALGLSSAFSAIEGHVFARGPNGVRIPVANVIVDLDGHVRTQTGSGGGFGFGRLSPGSHSIDLVSSSLPAIFAVNGTLARTIVTRRGEIAKVDFESAQLGSIAGRVVIEQEFKGAPKGGILNAYVVAQPGEHAAITDEEGRFVIDNLPPGTYKVEVDPETIPEGGIPNAASDVTVAPGAHAEGVIFKVGERERDIVFTFKKTAPSTAALSLVRRALPSMATTVATLTTPAAVTGVTLLAFGQSTAMESVDRKHWRGSIEVPAATPNGASVVKADVVDGKRHVSATADLAVDNSIPLFLLSLQPSKPQVGQYVQAQGRFLLAIQPSDQIVWMDGTTSKIERVGASGLFHFTVKILRLPYEGYIRTKKFKVPISIGK